MINFGQNYHLYLRSTLHWFESFFFYRTQRVFGDNEVSTPISVESGLIQGSIVGPVFIILFFDLLLKVISVDIFADNIKLLIEVKANNYSRIQCFVDVIVNWPNENRIPLFIENVLFSTVGVTTHGAHTYYLGKTLSNVM